MNSELLARLQAAQEAIDPLYKILHTAAGVLKRASKLAGEEPLDAIAMQKLLAKLEAAAAPLDSEPVRKAVAAFAAQTQHGLDALAFEFARDLKEVFQQRGQSVEGRPPTLVVDLLTLHIDMATRKARWFYGREPLTNPIPLSINAIIKAYDKQTKSVFQRTFDEASFMAELYKAWQDSLAKRQKATPGKRINIVEVYSQVTLNRQTGRFWNSPSRSTFKDYERAHFVRDLVVIQSAPTVTVDGTTFHLRLGGATKSQADNPARSIWLPRGGLDGEYYSDVTFSEE